jgi:hypothetical protein
MGWASDRFDVMETRGKRTVISGDVKESFRVQRMMDE